MSKALFTAQEKRDIEAGYAAIWRHVERHHEAIEKLSITEKGFKRNLPLINTKALICDIFDYSLRADLTTSQLGKMNTLTIMVWQLAKWFESALTDDDKAAIRRAIDAKEALFDRVCKALRG